MSDVTDRLDHAAVVQTVNDIVNGNRRDARLAIRMHADPAWFVLEVLVLLAEMTGSHASAVAADVRRLMRGPHE